MFYYCNQKLFEGKHIHYPVNPSGDHFHTDAVAPSTGVHQGSILGPLLFTLDVNDLSSVAVHGKVVLYADDTAIFVSGKNTEYIQGKLNSDLERISAWLYANKLTLNAKNPKNNAFLYKPAFGQAGY